MEVLENSYKIKTGSFEGPFGLLLNLVQERKLFINEISLSQVTEDFLKYISTLNSKDHGEIASFMVVAATLILIKSKSLLPGLDLTTEEAGDIRNLEDRLRLYQIYSELSQEIKNNFGQKIIFAPLERKPARLNGFSRSGGNDILIFLPDDQITQDSMMAFASDVLGRIPKKTFMPEVEVRKVISIEEMIDKLTDRIKNALQVNFKSFAGEARTKEERVVVIVGFLAMLEMVRQGIVNVAQDKNFDEIMIERQEIVVESLQS